MHFYFRTLKKKSINYFLLSTVFVVLQRSLNWPLVKVFNLQEKNYCDFYAILKVGELSFDQWLSKKQDIPYGDLVWFIFRQVKMAYLPPEGILLVFQIAFVFSLFAILGKRLKTSSIIFILFLAPPVSFVLQRSNLDMVIFVMVTIAMRHKQIKTFSLLLLVIASLLKFYPILLILFLIGKENKKRFNLLIVSTFFLVVIEIFREIRQVGPSFVGSVQYGVATFGFYAATLFQKITNQDLWYSEQGWTLIGFVLYLSLFLLIQSKVRSNIKARLFLTDITLLGSESDDKIWFVTIFLTCYLSTLNYDYRLVFLLPLLQNSKFTTNLIASVYNLNFYICGAIVFSGAIWVPLQFVGDLCLFILSVVFIISKVNSCDSWLRKSFRTNDSI